MFMIRSLVTGKWFLLYDNTFLTHTVEWSDLQGYVFEDAEMALGIAALLNESVEVLMMESYWKE